MKFKRAMVMTIALSIVGSSVFSVSAAANSGMKKETPGNGRTNFITSDMDINEQLKREYIDNVPLGYSEDLFSLYQPGWGFDKPDVYRTGIASGFGMPVTVTANGISVLAKEAEFTPSFVASNYSPEETAGPKLIKTNISLNAKSVYQGAQAEGYPLVDASFSQELWGKFLAQAYQGTLMGEAANWNTFRRPEDLAAAPVPEGGDWTSIEFSKDEEINEIRIHTCANADLAYPEQVTAYAWNTNAWNEIAASTGKSTDGWYTLLLAEPVTASKFKLVFEVEEGKALAADSIEYLQYSYDESGLEKYEINHAVGATRTGDPLVDTSFSQEAWGATLEYAFDGNNALSANQGWNTFRQPSDHENFPKPSEGDWITLEFNEEKDADALAVYAYSDGGNTLTPDDVKIMYQSEENWVEVNYKEKPASYISGKNMLTFDSVKAKKFKIVFTEKSGKCISMNEIELIHTIFAKPQKISVKGYKYISPDNMLVTILEAENRGEESSIIEVSAVIPEGFTDEENTANGTLVGMEAKMQGDSDFQKMGTRLKKKVVLEPNEKSEFKVVLSLSKTQEENAEKISRLLSDASPEETQKAKFTEWFAENIPYLDVPDETLKQIYYFRWYTYRNHIRKTTDDSYIISEFLPNVPWAGKHNSINCPAGLHVAEGRWLQNGEYLDDYLSHWLDNGGAVRSYSFWIADAYYNRYLATGDKFVFNYVEKLKSNFEAWNDHYNADLGLYWQLNDRDGMENSISSAFGYRPTINSYMYGDASALSKLCALTGDEEGAKIYAGKAADIKEKFDSKTWDSQDSFYKVIACQNGGGLTNGEQLQGVKEQIGYIPWMFNMPDNDAKHSAAWKYVMDENYFLAPYGLLTAEKSLARVTPDGEYGTGTCRWDGPVWPFATSQTLTGMANLLNNYNQNEVTDEDYFYLLKNYAEAQYKNGAPWIAEDLDGFSGRWIADERRSPNYNHSSFNDLVISGLFGIRPNEGDSLTLNPLIPEGEWDSFCLENVPYHGQNITMLYDKTGSVYGEGSGFKVYLDGIMVHSSEKPESAVIQLEEKVLLDKIEVTAPAKTEYKVGEAFEPAGMKVTAYYTDDSRKELQADQYRVSGFDSASPGTKVITVSYKEGELTKTADFTVTVREYSSAEEAAIQAAKEAREAADAAKADAVTAKADAKAAEGSANIAASEAEKAAEEAQKATSEAGKAKTEADQAKAEADRALTEAGKSEAAKLAAVAAQEKAAEAQKKAEEAQGKAEAVRDEAAEAKKKAEAAQGAAETAKEEAKAAEAAAQTAAAEAETAKTAAVSAKDDAVAAKAAAEAARDNAVSAKNDAFASKTAAEAAKMQAESAKADAIAAKIAAESAKADAEAAKTAAEAARADAVAAKTAAQAAAQAAAESAEAAKKAKEEAEKAAADAAQKKKDAEEAKIAAEKAQDAAQEALKAARAAQAAAEAKQEELDKVNLALARAKQDGRKDANALAIVGKRANIKSARNAKGKIKIVLKKVKAAEGYQIQCAAKKNFKGKAVTKITSKPTYTMKNLKKKNYFVRVRAYTTNSKGKKVYSKWSTVKRVQVK